MDQREFVQTSIMLMTAAQAGEAVLEEVLKDVNCREWVKTCMLEQVNTIESIKSGKFDPDKIKDLIQGGGLDDFISETALALADDSQD